jgi:hypothetical protein
MSFEKKKLLNFLNNIDCEVNKKITLIAVGGTAMTLLDIKSSTIDIDFTIPNEDYNVFVSALKKIPHGFKIDCWRNGMVFSQILPEDYIEKSLEITSFKNIQLRALHPIDIIVTKVGRLDNRDLEDIKQCIFKYKIGKDDIKKRASLVDYVGNESNYQYNLCIVLKRFF